jgi:hypothetical protein
VDARYRASLQEGITSISHIPHQSCEEWKSCFLTVMRSLAS